MKKTLLVVGCDCVGEASASVTLKDSLPALPTLPATSAHLPALKSTLTLPFLNVPVR